MEKSMDFNERIAILYKMRFLENEGDDIEVFESILNELANKGTNDIIPDLCIIFEDDWLSHQRVTTLLKRFFYIAEHSGVEEGLYKLAISIPKMLPHAEFWAERIHRTLLHSKGLVVSYMNVLENINNSTK
ncbi:Imm30 family immunity protein [Bacillus sp. MHSD_36]|uniref:Imm30 family immunity protein n=1 Tax=unclassified Bacillus (in: firmicutes) TaxID=185979 RepID=UPI002740CDF0|nr:MULTISPECIES: Imm30 family immunity protein [unclassified Bacillus (in: firmicutes)]MDP7988688.1 Imm30 family immunity protein [Bacillus sp. MHSD_36]MDR4978038.1 Imm30 family immunity protein [Bacillus sp. MHSD_37]